MGDGTNHNILMAIGIMLLFGLD